MANSARLFTYMTSVCAVGEVVEVMALYASLLSVQSCHYLHILLSDALGGDITAPLEQLATASTAAATPCAAPSATLLRIPSIECTSALDASHFTSLVAHFDRVLYIGPSSMFVRNADSLLNGSCDAFVPAPAGSVSHRGVADRGVLLFEPRAGRVLPNEGQPVRELPVEYWSRVSIDTAAGAATTCVPGVECDADGGQFDLNGVSVVIARFDSDHAPWNWYSQLNHPALVLEPPILYWRWMQHARAAYNATGKAPPFDSLQLASVIATEQVKAGAVPVRQHIPPADSVCDHQPFIQRLSTAHFSVLVGHFFTGNLYRLQLLAQLVSHYRNLTALHTIFITWHDPNSTVPSTLRDWIQRDREQRQASNASAYVAPVVFLPMRTDSLNNRFLPVPASATRALFVTDEDVLVPAAEMELGFSLWQSSPQQLVGYFPRSHGVYPPPAKPVKDGGSRPRWEYVWKTAVVTREYSIVLTKGMFVDSVYNYLYTCLLPRRFHQYVDLFTNGEDILYQMMVTGLTGLPPTAVDSHPDEYGVPAMNMSALAGGISSVSGHFKLRSVITSDLVTLFGTMPLRYSRHMASNYIRPLAVKRQLDSW